MHTSIPGYSNIQEFIKRDKKAAIQFLHREYGNMLYGFIYSNIKNHDATNAIIRHVFEELPKRIHTYNENNLRFFSWLLQLARKKLGPAALKTPVQDVAKGKDFSAVVERMGRRHAEIFTLSYVVGYSAHEIAIIKSIDSEIAKEQIKEAAKEFARCMRIG